MKRKSIPILIFVIILCGILLTGCPASKSLYMGFNKYDRNAKEGLFSCGAESRRKNEFDIDNIELDFYFGHKVENPNPDDYNFVSVVAVFMTASVYPNRIWEGSFDSYKDAPGIHIAKEFTVDEFFSETYAVQRGRYGTYAYAYHEKMIVPKEFTELLILDSSGFYFAIWGVAFDDETDTYSFTAGEKSSYHLIRIRYWKLENGKIRLADDGRNTWY
jgi:hypothetical protein